MKRHFAAIHRGASSNKKASLCYLLQHTRLKREHEFTCEKYIKMIRKEIRQCVNLIASGWCRIRSDFPILLPKFLPIAYLLLL